MKKTILTSAALLAALFVGVATQSTVHAADSDAATGKSTAEFNVEAGAPTDPDNPDKPGIDVPDTDGNLTDLTLVQIPDMHFQLNGANPKVGDFIAGTTLNYVDGTVAVKHTADNSSDIENDKGAIEVDDYRGNNAGWVLNASVDQPTSGSTKLTGTLNLSADVNKFTSADVTGDKLSAALTTDGTSQTVWTANQNEGEGLNTATVNKDTTFALDANTAAVVGQYDATVTWELTSGVATDANATTATDTTTPDAG